MVQWTPGNRHVQHNTAFISLIYTFYPITFWKLTCPFVIPSNNSWRGEIWPENDLFLVKHLLKEPGWCWAFTNQKFSWMFLLAAPAPTPSPPRKLATPNPTPYIILIRYQLILLINVSQLTCSSHSSCWGKNYRKGACGNRGGLTKCLLMEIMSFGQTQLKVCDTSIIML